VKGSITLLLVLALTGCTWAKRTDAGAQVRVAEPNDVAGCERIGTATATTKVFGRHENRVKLELENLASNRAADIGGDTIVAEGPAQDGRQTFIVYRCASRSGKLGTVTYFRYSRLWGSAVADRK